MTTTNGPAPGAHVCPECGGTDLAYDWDGVVSIHITDDAVVTVTVGGVLGVPPDRMTCFDCSEIITLANHPASDDLETAMGATVATLPARLESALEDGFDLTEDMLPR